jgi:hypothetical protein
MNCLECQDLLQRRLDGEAVIISPAMRRHLAACPSCRVLHASGQVLLGELRTVPAPALAGDFSQRMTVMVLRDRRQRKRLRLVVTAALAASLLIMALAGYFVSGPGPVAKVNIEKMRIDHPDQMPHLAQSVDDTRQAFASLSERWAEHAREQTKNFLAAAKPIDIPGVDFLQDMAEPLEPAAQSLQQAGQGVAESLQPVTTSAGRALAYLLRDLPVPVFEKGS